VTLGARRIHIERWLQHDRAANSCTEKRRTHTMSSRPASLLREAERGPTRLAGIAAVRRASHRRRALMNIRSFTSSGLLLAALTVAGCAEDAPLEDESAPDLNTSQSALFNIPGNALWTMRDIHVCFH
jgi:hypothetical protein